mmetsp:Transcript_5990/g.12677  ORF Transcript_5990/g.12677 Transcript_5990/m.12677 type:complete len:228 (-) Transcript_5990:113-796(-)
MLFLEHRVSNEPQTKIIHHSSDRLQRDFRRPQRKQHVALLHLHGKRHDLVELRFARVAAQRGREKVLFRHVDISFRGRDRSRRPRVKHRVLRHQVHLQKHSKLVKPRVKLHQVRGRQVRAAPHAQPQHVVQVLHFGAERVCGQRDEVCGPRAPVQREAERRLLERRVHSSLVLRLGKLRPGVGGARADSVERRHGVEPAVLRGCHAQHLRVHDRGRVSRAGARERNA